MTPVGLVMGLLAFVGLRPGARVPGVPVTPLSQVIELLWVGLRRIESRLFNRTPTPTYSLSEQDAAGTITATISPNDPDGDPVTYQIVGGPAHGTVADNGDGTFTYSADPAYAHENASYTDIFTVRVSDASRTHLLLFARSGHTADVPIAVTVERINEAPTIDVAPAAGPADTTVSPSTPGIPRTTR